MDWHRRRGAGQMYCTYLKFTLLSSLLAESESRYSYYYSTLCYGLRVLNRSSTRRPPYQTVVIRLRAAPGRRPAASVASAGRVYLPPRAPAARQRGRDQPRCHVFFPLCGPTRTAAAASAVVPGRRPAPARRGSLLAESESRYSYYSTVQDSQYRMGPPMGRKSTQKPCRTLNSETRRSHRSLAEVRVWRVQYLGARSTIP
jgi:hypothetical protein